MINFDDFIKTDLRVARIVEAEDVEDADKLLKITVDLGDEENKEHVLKVCTTSINLFFKIMVMLKPVVPSIAKSGESFLNIEQTDWDSINTRLLNHQISDYKPLLTRIENENIEAMLG